MKIVDRQTFLAMPEGTVFQKYREQNFDTAICIKFATMGNDFVMVDLAGVWPVDCDGSDSLFARYEEMERGAPSGPLDFECGGRDGLFDADQRFAVWDRADVEGLIKALQAALD